MICKECGQEIKNWYKMKYHLQNHNMTSKEYYDKHISKPNEKICPICGKENNFINPTKGYSKFCNQACYVEYMKTIEWNKQQKETKFNHYGNAKFCNSAQSKQTRLLKNGGKYHSAKTLLQIKETNKQKYGSECVMHNATVKQKFENTCLEKYGVIHPMQNHEIFCKSRQKYEYDGLKFDSKPEIELYKQLKTENADFEYQPDIFFEYEYEGKIHKYYPDFRIGNEYVELKGLMFFLDHNPKNRMINPFNRMLDDLMEAKHQCMINNNIRIIVV